jgi:predicted sulfurtransferase
MTEARTPADPTPTFRLVYRSHSRVPADRRTEALAAIFDAARANNEQLQVTGALLITDHYFVQTLEGEESRVRALFERIRNDDRHDEIQVVAEEAPADRVFGQWAMARVSAAGGADIPLHTTEGGTLRPAAPASLTRDQATLLQRMRNTIGADVV